MLDVGAATGFFLDLARGQGWRVQGVEPSDHAASLARAKGIDVRTGVIESCDAPSKSFDAITMWDVIEHLPDPAATMGRVAELLKPGGVVAINTPDSGSALATLMGENWHLVVPPERLNLFHRRSLRVLLEKQGFEILQTTSLGKRFTLQYIAQTLSHWWNIKPIEAAHRRLRRMRAGQWSVPLNLFDNVFVLARKR
jgi:2-polyprenyl-3-methyl-5-hydroxy-6-metoxy-1,4-benzoquinol methylase